MRANKHPHARYGIFYPYTNVIGQLIGVHGSISLVNQRQFQFSVTILGIARVVHDIFPGHNIANNLIHFHHITVNDSNVGSLVHAHANGQRVSFCLRCQFHRNHANSQHRQQQQPRGGDNHYRFVRQCPANHALIALFQPVENAFIPGCRLIMGRLMCWHTEKTAGKHRHQRQGHKERTHQGEYNHQCHFLEHGAGHGLHENNRQEDHRGGQGRGNDGTGHLLGASLSRILEWFTLLPVPNDVLDHDNGIIDNQTNPQREATEAHLVQRQTAEIKQCKRCYDRNRNGNGNNAGNGAVTEKGEQHNNSENAAPDGRVSNAIDRVLDKLTLVGDHQHFQIIALKINPLHFLADLLSHRYRIGTGLFADRHANHWCIVNLDIATNVGAGITDISHITNSHRHTFHRTNDDVLDFSDCTEFTHRANIQLRHATPNIATWRIVTFTSNGLADIAHGQPTGEQAITANIDTNFAVYTTPDINRTNTGDLLKSPTKVSFHDGSQVHQVHIGTNTQHDNRCIIRIEAVNPWRISIFGQTVAQPIQCLAHIIRYHIDINALGKSQTDRTSAFL